MSSDMGGSRGRNEVVSLLAQQIELRKKVKYCRFLNVIIKSKYSP